MRNWFGDRLFSLRNWIILVCSLIALVVIYYIAADRYTPYTSNAYMQAYVVQVAPQVPGNIVAVYVRNNQAVKAGDRLFEIDPRPFQHAVSRLGAQLVETQHQVTQYEKELEAQEQIVEERKADLKYAEQRFDEISRLVKQKTAPVVQLQQVTDNLNSRKAAVHEATAEVEKLKSRLTALVDGEHATIKQVRAQLATAKLRLSQTTVQAPVTGIIDNLQLRVGTYASVGDAVLSLVDTTNWWVVANFQENALSVIRPGQQVNLSFPMYPGVIFDGRVESIGRGVSKGQGVPSGDLPKVETPLAWISLAQRFPVRISVDTTKRKLPLRIGATATIVVYRDKGGLMNALGLFWLRIRSIFNYLY